MSEEPKFQLTEEDEHTHGHVEKPKAGAPKSAEDIHIDELLHIIVDKNASDLHLCADSEPVIREDGALKRLNFEKLESRPKLNAECLIFLDENIRALKFLD